MEDGIKRVSFQHVMDKVVESVKENNPDWFDMHKEVFFETTDYMFELTQDEDNFSKQFYEADLRRGDGGGSSNAIVVRGDPYPLCSYDKAWDTAYYLQYSHNGYYGIWKATGGCGWAWIQPWTYTAAINQGDAWNELKVWCVGDQMYFFINDVLVYVVTDNSFNTGKVGLSYFAGAGGGFQTDYATLEIVGVAARPVEEVSKQQRLLNEKAKRKNARLPKEYCSKK